MSIINKVYLNTNPRAEMSRHFGLWASAFEENKCWIISVCAAALHSDASIYALKYKSPGPWLATKVLAVTA